MMNATALNEDARNLHLVLLAGLLCDAEIWRDVCTLLEPRARVSIMSFPAFYSVESMATQVLRSIEGPFALAGHSMGGRVALEVARRCPSRLLGLALLNTGTHPAGPQEPESRGRLVQLSNSAGMRAVAREWLPPMLAHARDEQDPILARLTEMVSRSDPSSFAAQISALLTRPDASSVLPGIRVPVLLASGSNDSWSPPAQHEAMRDSCLGAELSIIEGAGHMAPIEQPHAVARALATWLERINSRQSAEGNLS